MDGKKKRTKKVKLDPRLQGKMKKGLVRATKKDYEFVQENFQDKIEKYGEKIWFLRDAVALYKYIMDKNVPWARKVFAVGALLYLIMPLDAIPDFTPVIGFLDDAGVLAVTAAYYAHEIKPYYGKGE